MKVLFVILFGLAAVGPCALAGPLDTWTSQVSGTTNNLNAIIYALPTYVAVGNGGTILTSSNGVDWVLQNSGTTNNLYGITWANGLFVAVGQGLVLTSPDGVDWAAHLYPTLTLYSVTCGDGLLAAVGASGVIRTSPDGTNWAAQVSGTSAAIRAITYGKGRFLATGASILMSTNGINWVNVSLRNGLWADIFADGQFVAVGGYVPIAAGAFIFSSPDGTNWTTQSVGGGLYNFYGITWGNGSFVTVGGPGGMGGGAIWSSSDAVNWAVRLTNANPTFLGVTYGNGYFVVVGSNGAILQSGPIFSLAGEIQSGSGFQVALTGQIGCGYHLQTSTDLANWTNLVNFTNTAETMLYLDTDATNYPWRFYRAISP